MNVNLLITDSIFTVTNTYSGPSKPEQSNKGAKFSLSPDDKPSQVNNIDKPTTDNEIRESQNKIEPVNESPHEITQSNPRKTKSENTAKTENKNKTDGQRQTSDNIEQTNEQQAKIQNRSAEHLMALEQGKEVATPKIEPNAGQELAQIITNATSEKPSSVTGHAVKSAEIKLLHATEKGQLGIKTVLPAKSNGENGLKVPLIKTIQCTTAGNKQTETVNAEQVTELTRTITETKSATDTRSATESASEINTDTGKTANVSAVKQTTENFNLTNIQAKNPQVLPQSEGIDTEKSAPNDQKDAKVNASLKIPNLSDTYSKETKNTGNDTTENQSIPKLNLTAMQVSSNQIKDRSISTSDKDSSQGLEQILSHNNSQTVIAEQASAAAKSTTRANIPSQNSSSDVSTDIGKQILESVQRTISQQGDERQITVRLNPPELGKVSIKFQQHENELTGLMEVSKNQTRHEIEQTLPQIIRNLADSGIQIKRLEVVLSNEQQSGQGAFGNQSLQSGGSQQQYSGNPNTSGNDMDIQQSNEWLASNYSYEGLSELQETLITDSSINMLL